MAFANLLDVTTQTLASGTSYNINMPTTVNTGDLLLAVIRLNDNESLDVPTGWTQEGEITGGLGRSFIYYKSAVGDEGGTSVTFNQDAGPTASDGYSQIYRYEAGTWTAVEIGTSTNEKTSAPDPVAFNPSWAVEDTTWFSLYATMETVTIDSLPTNYTLANEERQNGITGTLSVARRQATIETEDPDAYALNTAVWSGFFVFAVQGVEDSPLSGNITLSANPEQSVEVGIWELSTLSFNLSDLGTPEEVVSTDANGDWEGTHDPTKTYFIAVLHNKLIESGTASGGSLTSLDDSSKSMTADEHAGRMIEITGGTGSGQMRKIASNTATSFTPDVDFDTAPDNTSTYEVYDMYGATTRILPVTG